MAHLGSWERDYRAGTMTWSDELFRLCGLEPGSVTPSVKKLFAHTHPLDRERAIECTKTAMQSGKGAEIEVRMAGADGVLRNVFIRTEVLKDAAGELVGSRGTVTDVTERVRALQEQTKFVSLIENSRDFVAMATLDGRMLSMNPAARALWAWSGRTTSPSPRSGTSCRKRPGSGYARACCLSLRARTAGRGSANWSTWRPGGRTTCMPASFSFETRSMER